MSADNLLKCNRIGETSFTKYGTSARIIDYINNKKVLIEFDDTYHYRYYTSYINFVNRSIMNPYDKNIFGVAFIGSGKYNSKNESFYVWYNMISRCYNDKRNIKNQSYENCTVDIVWHNFQNFAEWYDNNKYNCNETLMLDKDIRYSGNTTYSPDNCMLVPKTINLLFVNSKGKGELPVGITYSKNKQAYEVFIAQTALSKSKTKYLGTYYDLDKAKECYAFYKSQYIREVLNQYKDVLPNKIFETIYNYKIPID